MAYNHIVRSKRAAASKLLPNSKVGEGREPLFLEFDGTEKYEFMANNPKLATKFLEGDINLCTK